MATCTHCGQAISCPEHAHGLGTSEKCPTSKGALWVQVIDYKKTAKTGVSVRADEADAVKPTDESGYAVFDPLDAGSYTVSLTKLPPSLEPAFYLPEENSRTASVADGQISLLKIRIPSWISVRIENDAGDVIDDIEVKVTLPDGTVKTEKLTADKLTDGAYRIGDLPPGECDISIPELYDIEWAEK